MFKRLVAVFVLLAAGVAMGQESASSSDINLASTSESSAVSEELSVTMTGYDKANPGFFDMATIIRKPFVIDGEGGLEGFSIDVWDEVARELGIEFRYHNQPVFSQMIDMVNTGEVDGAVSNITINATREATMDFTDPIFNHGGFQIGVLDRGIELHLLEALQDPEVWVWAIVFVMILLVTMHIIWIFGRKHGDMQNIYFRPGYVRGLVDAFWWLNIDMLRKDVPLGVPLQLVALVWKALSLVILLAAMALIASNITQSHERQAIDSFQDLYTKRVGATGGTTMEQFLIDNSIAPLTYDHFDEVIAALEREEIDAVLFDAPVIQYFVLNEGKGRVKLAGQRFKPEEFGILLTDQNPLRSEINETLQNMRNDGRYDAIYKKWFGE